MRPAMSFADKLSCRMAASQSLLCVGLDPVPDRMPKHLDHSPEGVLAFCRDIVEATHRVAAAYKPNLGFFAALGPAGFDVLWRVRQAIPADIPVILDGKVNDMGETARAWARGLFDAFDFDAITVNPYMGEDALSPYLERDGRGVLVLCRNSNAGSGDFQELPVDDGSPLYLVVARRTRQWQARFGADVGLVVGATWPDDLLAVRQECPDQLILLPGVGAQGGDLQASVRCGLDATGAGLLVSTSRAVMFASNGEDYREAAGRAARDFCDQIEQARQQAAAMTS